MNDLFSSRAINTSDTPAHVCRDINVEIERNDGGEGWVVAEAIPEGRVETRRHLSGVLRGRGLRLEAAGRKDLLNIGIAGQNSLIFGAVHSAFENHYPLAIRPEVLMYLVLHEVAIAVKKNPEVYRDLFSTSADKQTIRVRHDGLMMGDPDSPWADALSLFGPALAAKVPPGLMAHALPSFSTHSQESAVSTLAAFMDAGSPYYEFLMMSLCGIPRIRLLGTPKDYRKIVVACAGLAEVFEDELGRYFQHLLPVVETIARQAAGAPVDQRFWSSIYKFESRSGGDTAWGWLTAFVNYGHTKDEIVPKEDHLYPWSECLERGTSRLVGYSCESLPTHVSTVPFVWIYLNHKIEMVKADMVLAGGGLGLEVEDGFVCPQLSWAVMQKES